MKFFKILLVFLLFASTAVFGQKKEIYANFPENFESPDTAVKAHYKKQIITLKSGEWNLDYALLGALPGHDRFNPIGKQSIRIQQNRSKSAFLEMNFDLNEGASKVTIAYAVYYKDASSIWKLEYSTDQGLTWVQAGKDILTESTDLKTAEFNLDIKGKVRFRINKLGLGDGKQDSSIKNGRLSIDDIAIYKN
ncbi:hypothetical protein EZ428_14635 [Pedobacter frigiditerrae]|uniref:Uncharacterized protein n=1 Tax=Pedobacter frigiditerrae TaxID=2530452 RepID=A0A4R0MUR7_9SPHI|nr:hypothetical protein [Pedobacter frigiditerrae]TCC90507.1 hypothetical protein EZ428_14635 [Pedobacter frigiditerrae]